MQQFCIAEVTSNHIIDWTSILQRKGQGGSKGLQSTVECVCNFGINFFITEVTSNRILDWTSILQRKGQGSSKRFTQINILFVRYCVFYLPDWAKSGWLCNMNDHHSFFQWQQSKPTLSCHPVSLKLPMDAANYAKLAMYR